MPNYNREESSDSSEVDEKFAKVMEGSDHEDLLAEAEKSPSHRSDHIDETPMKVNMASSMINKSYQLGQLQTMQEINERHGKLIKESGKNSRRKRPTFEGTLSHDEVQKASNLLLKDPKLH